MAESVADPPGGDDRLGQDLLGFRSSENIGDVDARRGRHIEAGRRVRLRVHVDDQGRNSPVVGRRGETERHGCLTDSAFEAADTEDKHAPTLTYRSRTGRGDHAETPASIGSGPPAAEVVHVTE